MGVVLSLTVISLGTQFSGFAITVTKNISCGYPDLAECIRYIMTTCTSRTHQIGFQDSVKH